MNLTWNSCEVLIWGFGKRDKFDTINRLIPLSVTPLSGAHCIHVLYSGHRLMGSRLKVSAIYWDNIL
jgi:hypothetical protein